MLQLLIFKYLSIFNLFTNRLIYFYLIRFVLIINFMQSKNTINFSVCVCVFADRSKNVMLFIFFCFCFCYTLFCSLIIFAAHLQHMPHLSFACPFFQFKLLLIFFRLFFSVFHWLFHALRSSISCCSRYF